MFTTKAKISTPQVLFYSIFPTMKPKKLVLQQQKRLAMQ